MTQDIEILKNKALEIAQRYVDYKSYGQSETKAIAALKKKCPNWDRGIYELWFRKAVSAHQDAVAYVNKNSEQAWDLYQENRKNVDLQPMAENFHEAHPEFMVNQLHDTLVFAFYFWHLK